MKKYYLGITLFLLVFILCLFKVPALTVKAQGQVVEVTAASRLNVRSGPGIKFPIIKSLEKGTIWYTDQSSNGWLRIANSQWIYGSYTRPSIPLKTVVTTAHNGLNVRRGTGINYSKIRILPLNSRVDVLQEKNGWYKIGNDEWIFSGYTKDCVEHDVTINQWYYIPSSNHQVPTIYTNADTSKYDTYYLGNVNNKTVYLTFNLTHEAGYTSFILDVLKSHGVKATFFVTQSYINDNKEFIKRMVAEGHVVGNYVASTPSLPQSVNEVDKFINEILCTASAFKDTTGKEMTKLIRPAMGDYSEKSLYMTQMLGYKTIFWSLSYYDYNEYEQPDPNYALYKLTSEIHNGAIIQLSGFSKTNKEIISKVIEKIQNQGYNFDTLD